MKVALYLDSQRFGQWSLKEFMDHRMALSGTLGSGLMLFRMLTLLRVRCTILCNGLPSDSPWPQVAHANDFAHAVTIARSGNWDVLVFVNCNDEQTRLGVAATVENGQTCIAWDHNGPHPDFRDLFARSKCIRRVVCVSHCHSDWNRGHPVFDKVAVVPNAIDVDFWRKQVAKRRDNQVAFLGALVPQKGFQFLARAWPEVREEFPNAKLMVCGGGSLYRNVSFGPLGIADHDFEMRQIVPFIGKTKCEARKMGVHFSGLLDKREIRRVLQTSLMTIVNPSCKRNAETFCVSAVESEATGTCVVGGKAGGLRETVRAGETGILIRREKGLGKALVQLLASPEKAINMGRRGPAFVASSFSLDVVSARWAHLLSDVVAGHPGKPVPFSLGRLSMKLMVKELFRRSSIRRP